MSERSHTSPKPPRKDFAVGVYAFVSWEDGETLYELEQHPHDTCPSWERVDFWEHDDPEINRIFLPESTFIEEQHEEGPLPVIQKQLGEDGNLKATWYYLKDYELPGGAHTEESREIAEIGENNEDTKEEQSKTETEEVKNDNRELTSIESGTSHHLALYIIKRLSDGDNNKIPSTEIYNQTSEPQGTISSALTDLYKRELLERNEIKNKSGNRSFEYYLSPHGEAEIEEHGKPPDENLDLY